jgi:hypothetical protein
MIQISTQDLQLLLENQEEKTCSLQNEENEFYDSIKSELNKEIRQPHPTTIDRIMAYSKNL